MLIFLRAAWNRSSLSSSLTGEIIGLLPFVTTFDGAEELFSCVVGVLIIKESPLAVTILYIYYLPVS